MAAYLRPAPFIARSAGKPSRTVFTRLNWRDGVTSEADILYGISMNEHGMSKVTTLKI